MTFLVWSVYISIHRKTRCQMVFPLRMKTLWLYDFKHNSVRGRSGVGVSLSQPSSVCLVSRQEVTNNVGRINSGPNTLYKWSPHDKPMKAQKGDGVTAPSHSQNCRPTREDGWSERRSGRFCTRKDQVRMVQGAWWASGAVWTARKMSPPLRFDPRTSS